MGLEQTPKEAWLSFKDISLTAADKRAPIIKRCVGGRYVPWLTPEIKDHIYISVIMNIRKRYQQILTKLSYTGVITKHYAMLLTPKFIKRNVVVIPTSCQVTGTVRK